MLNTKQDIHQNSTFQHSRYSSKTYKTNQHRKHPRNTKPLSQTMAAIITSPIKPNQPYHLDFTDDESHRGRKRRRSSDHTPPMQIPSTGSTAMRGRCRHRSLSAPQTFSPSELSPSSDRRAYRVDSPGGRGSPRRKFMKKNLVVPETKRRRSQSPSRSRSLNGVGTPKPRRRQRTRSRSRSHRRVEGNSGDGVEGDETEAVAEN